MKNEYELDYELYPDGISKELKSIEESVWDRGYYLDVENGTWYELYINDTIKSYYPDAESITNDLEGYKALWLGNYNDSSQITFFVPTQ